METIKLLFEGYAETVKHELKAVMVGNQNPETDRWYLDLKKQQKYFRGPVGSVWEVEHKGEGVITLSSAKFLSLITNHKELQVKALAEKRAFEGRKAVQRMKNTELDALKPFRLAYLRAVGSNKTQLLAAIVQYITSGKE